MAPAFSDIVMVSKILRNWFIIFYNQNVQNIFSTHFELMVISTFLFFEVFWKIDKLYTNI